MSSSPTTPESNEGQLGLFDAISIIIGIIIGAGIYETPAGIFRMMSGPWTTLGLWAICGLLALIGALCYAELATTYPRSGGDYVYLTRAYGPLVGYFFGWTQLAVIQTGSIGLMAFVFADYGARLWKIEDLGWATPVLYASVAIVVMTFLNVIGVVFGKRTQNLLFLAKVLGLTGIIVAGFFFSKQDHDMVEGVVNQAKDQKLMVESQGQIRTFQIGPKTKILINNEEFQETKDKEKKKNTLENLPSQAAVTVITAKGSPNEVLEVKFKNAPGFSMFAFAMVLIFLTYGGWNDAAFVAAEVRNRNRNIPLALIFGTAGVTLIYLLVNGAYINGLGFERAAESREVAADVLKLLPWEFGEQAMCILVMISALGAVNGLIFTSSRIYATLGADYSLFAMLGKWNARYGTPVWSLLIQMVISLSMVAAVGTPWGQEKLNEGLGLLGLEPVSWAGQAGFYSLLRCTAPIFWIFFLMTGLALLVLRINDRQVVRPFSVPLFPILPLIFCATCAYMIYSGIGYAGRLGLVGAALVLAGLPFYVLSRRTVDPISSQDYAPSN